ncbi:hypothetical protein THAOC_28021 [Thalassiosira oceanica]|uniref:Uncharacterized protein n=1 Tax=Thalassiosira oceanica TaxID=159749 RepID=K0RKB2_THAOC|nr:hypothetical protein THAOC_28021 [Thalassiosira oceanica]|eukprot:EJK52679.1 hypothetical protein THAOC_28021 [Thalassiosira oceanica]
MHYQRPLLLCPAEAAALSLIQRRQWRRQTHIIRAKDSRYRSAVGGNSGHSGLLWGIEEHVKKIEAIHGNSGGVDADAVVHIFPGRSPTYSYAYTAGRAVLFFARASLTFALCKTQQPKKVRYEARRNFDWKKLPGSGTGLSQGVTQGR